MDEDWETTKKSNWTVDYNDKKQQGSLPRLSKNAPQHDKIVLNNDPRRFEGASALPTSETQSENEATHGQKPKITPLVGGINEDSATKIAEKIKTGSSVEYDSAIVAILRDAERESRELTSIERKTISDIKIARTKAMFRLIK